MNERHLSDDRLIEICVSGPAEPPEHAHIAVCATCDARRRSIVEILEELDAAAVVEADTAFPPDRLQRQQARIANRIELDGRPGRLITFPAYQPAVMARTRPHVRWAAAAAAAAFFIGLVAGHLAHDLPARDARPAGVAREANPGPLRAVSTTFSEDEFLVQIEVAAGSNGPAALRPLDDMTPRAWEEMNDVQLTNVGLYELAD
jgi:hypothetical protein